MSLPSPFGKKMVAVARPAAAPPALAPPPQPAPPKPAPLVKPVTHAAPTVASGPVFTAVKPIVKPAPLLSSSLRAKPALGGGFKL